MAMSSAPACDDATPSGDGNREAAAAASRILPHTRPPSAASSPRVMASPIPVPKVCFRALSPRKNRSKR